MLIEVRLKNGDIIKVLPGEVEILRKAGKLAVKEEKQQTETKEEKQAGETKDEKAAMERMIPSKKRTVNISAKNIYGRKSKKA